MKDTFLQGDAAKFVRLQFGPSPAPISDVHTFHCLRSVQIYRYIIEKLDRHDEKYAFYVDPDDEMAVEFILHSKLSIISVEGDMIYVSHGGRTQCFDFSDKDDAIVFIDSIFE